MNVKESHIKKIDEMMYQGIADMADNKIKKIDEELIPTFIIEESLNYFCAIEKYEICQKIKTFFVNYSAITVSSSREDWYGIPAEKVQKY